MATTTRKQQSTDTRNDPHPLASEDLSIRLTGNRTDGIGHGSPVKPRPTTRTNHPERGDQPERWTILASTTRHTVEFSKNRRASPTHPCGLCGRRLSSDLTRVSGPFRSRCARLPVPPLYQSFWFAFPFPVRRSFTLPELLDCFAGAMSGAAFLHSTRARTCDLSASIPTSRASAPVPARPSGRRGVCGPC